MKTISIEDFEPAVITVLERHYNEKGYEESKEIGEIPAIEFYHRIPKDHIPEGFHRLSVRGTDWSECDDLGELLCLCDTYREALRNHISDEEFDRMVKSLKEEDCPEDSDDFIELHGILNEALMDAGAPTIEGHEEMLAEGVLVNHWCDVLTKMSLDDIRKEFGFAEDAEVDIDLGYVEKENCPLWDEFKRNYGNI